MENIELLKKVRIFQGLCDDELEKFAAITTEESFPPQAVIIEEGAEGKALFIIKRGTVAVTKIDGEVETELVKLVAGDVQHLPHRLSIGQQDIQHHRYIRGSHAGGISKAGGGDVPHGRVGPGDLLRGQH